eukprot:4833180-Pyramimonas_sp.AAC.1
MEVFDDGAVSTKPMFRSGVVGTSSPRVQFKILMAYTDNYCSVGDLCADVNRQYAKTHGYDFRLVVLPYGEMLAVVGARDHPSWFKVHLLLEELGVLHQFDSTESNTNTPDAESCEGGKSTGDESGTNRSSSGMGPHPSSEGNGDVISYFVWLDGDAAVINFAQTLDDIARRGEYRDLIIGEDMHLGNLVNCGVMLIRDSDWSRRTWERVWNLRVKRNRTTTSTGKRLDRRPKKGDTACVGTEAERDDSQSQEPTCSAETTTIRSDSFYDRPFWEQSALQKVLKMENEFKTFFFGGSSSPKDSAKKGMKYVGWHSFTRNDSDPCEGDCNAVDRIAIYPHVSVFPMHQINSNIVDADLELLVTGSNPKGASFRSGPNGQRNRHRPAEFVYHAAGCNRRVELITQMLEARN